MENKLIKYLLIIVVLVLIVFLGVYIFRDEKISKSDIKGYKNYTNKKLDISFDFPEDYKVFIEDEIIYVSLDKDFSMPYYEIKFNLKSDTPNEYLNNSTKISKKELGYTFTPITEISSSAIGDKYVSKITYNYVKDDALIVENRYAFKYNGKVYAVSLREENNKQVKENDIIENIISSLK